MTIHVHVLESVDGYRVSHDSQDLLEVTVAVAVVVVAVVGGGQLVVGGQLHLYIHVR